MKTKIINGPFKQNKVIREDDPLFEIVSENPPKESKHILQELFNETHQKAIEIISNSGDLLHLLNENGTNGSNGMAHSDNPAHYYNHWHAGFPHRSKYEVIFHIALFKINKEIAKTKGPEHCFIFMPLPVAVSWKGQRIELDFVIFFKGRCIGIEVDGDSHIEKTHFEEEARLRPVKSAGIEIFRFRPDPKDDYWAEEAVKSIFREIESKRGF